MIQKLLDEESDNGTRIVLKKDVQSHTLLLTYGDQVIYDGPDDKPGSKKCSDIWKDALEDKVSVIKEKPKKSRKKS